MGTEFGKKLFDTHLQGLEGNINLQICKELIYHTMCVIWDAARPFLMQGQSVLNQSFCDVK